MNCTLLQKICDEFVSKLTPPPPIYQLLVYSRSLRSRRSQDIDTSNIDCTNPFSSTLVDRVTVKLDPDTLQHICYFDSWSIQNICDWCYSSLKVVLISKLPQKHPRQTAVYRWLRYYKKRSNDDEHGNVNNDIVALCKYLYDKPSEQTENNVVALLHRLQKKYPIP